MDLLPFILNSVIKRQKIHDLFGGNRQKGISVSKDYPYIFIFSGKTGHKHGYKDQWENENIFSYTGEGRINDMQFTVGNLALRDHIKNGKKIFLFTDSDVRSFVKFETELILEQFDFFPANDTMGNERLAIKFFFKRVGAKLEYQINNDYSLVNTLDENNYTIPNETERRGLVTSRVGQGAYRKSILYRWDFKCAVTNYSKNEILIASHILSWKDSMNDERLDVNNGILLSPTYDALFDQHLISFENNGKIILSDSLLKSNYDNIHVSGKEIITKFNSENYYYLERHRNKLI